MQAKDLALVASREVSDGLMRLKKSDSRHQARGQWKHIWTARTHPAPRLRPISTVFDEACRLVCSATINLDMEQMLQGRARPLTIRDWRRGRRRPPSWALDVLQEFLRSRGRSLLEMADQLENEKQKRL